MRTTSTDSPGSEFQSFLYAPICQEQEGMTLSVLSALARQDVDPWNEAARLSQLPKETAIKQITHLLEALPGRTLACLDLVEVSTRLDALLPRNAGSKPSGALKSPTASQQPATYAFNWRFFCLYLCFMLLTNWLMAEFRPPPPALGASPTPAGAPVTAPKSDSLVNNLGEEVPNPGH
jgi:hypothetical protein